MMCHLIAGFGNRDEFEYRRLLSFYPMKRDAEDWLEREGLYI